MRSIHDLNLNFAEFAVEVVIVRVVGQRVVGGAVRGGVCQGDINVVAIAIDFAAGGRRQAFEN